MHKCYTEIVFEHEDIMVTENAYWISDTVGHEFDYVVSFDERSYSERFNRTLSPFDVVIFCARGLRKIEKNRRA